MALAALTSANATAITGARSTYALGQTYPELRWLGRWHGRRETPGNALIAQGGVALVLVLAFVAYSVSAGLRANPWKATSSVGVNPDYRPDATS